MRQIALLSLFALLLSPLTAQEFSGGFRAGLNFNSFDGPAETDGSGMSLERFNRTTGFHVGATFALAFTDLFGLKADLMYSQRGGEVIYEGPSYFYLYSGAADDQGAVTFATRTSEVDVINSYLDIPVVAYYRLGKLELEGGVSAGLLVGSRASGGITYNAPAFGIENDIIFNVDGSFLSDPAGGAGIVAVSDTPLPNPNPSVQVFPPSVITPYYNSNRDDNLYRRLDFGLVVGLSYFLNNGLYVGARYQHGLTDVTNGENDLRITNEAGVEGRTFNADDEDFNRSIQASVGFRF